MVQSYNLSAITLVTTSEPEMKKLLMNQVFLKGGVSLLRGSFIHGEMASDDVMSDAIFLKKIAH